METIYINEQNLNYWQNHCGESVIALGFFDGIHKGHQKVIRTAAIEAKKRNVDLAIMSFFPHPKTVLSGGNKKFDYLMPLHDKVEILQSFGIDRVYIVEFDKNFASLSPKEFINKYLLNLGAVHAVAGYDFTYGKKGVGHIDHMKEDSTGKLETTKVEKVEHLGQKISSTRIRNMIAEGRVEDLPEIMGRPYEVKGEIIENNFISMEPCYILPGSGLYEVTIKSERDIFYTQVVIDQTEGLIFLSDRNLKIERKEMAVSITWRRSLSRKIMFDYS